MRMMTPPDPVLLCLAGCGRKTPETTCRECRKPGKLWARIARAWWRW